MSDPVPDDFPVWLSEPVKFVSEWRYYVLDGVVVGAGRYDEGPDEAPKPDVSRVSAAASEMSLSGSLAPAAYALDFGVMDDGRTALIEANDAWALGYYQGDTPGPKVNPCEARCEHRTYAKMLYARWNQLCNELTDA